MLCRFCKALRHYGDKAQIAENRKIDDNNVMLFIGGEPLTDFQLNELKVEVDLFKQTTLWKIMTSTISAHAVQLGLKEAKDFDQTIFAKSMLHVVGMIESTMKSIESEFQKRKKLKP